MSSPATVQPVGTVCLCVAVHSPPSVQFEYHHIWPREYGGPTTGANMVYICATTHNTVHAYLRAFMRAEKILNRADLRASLVASHYTPVVQGYAYALAARGFVAISAHVEHPASLLSPSPSEHAV